MLMRRTRSLIKRPASAVLTGAAAAVCSIVCSTALAALGEGLGIPGQGGIIGAVFAGVGVAVGLVAGLALRVQGESGDAAFSISTAGRLRSRDTAYSVLFGGGWGVVWLLAQFLGGPLSDPLAGHFETVHAVQALAGSVNVLAVVFAAAYAVAWPGREMLSSGVAGVVAMLWVAMPLVVPPSW